MSIYYLAKEYILNGKVIYIKWAINIIYFLKSNNRTKKSDWELNAQSLYFVVYSLTVYTQQACSGSLVAIGLS